MTSITLKVTPPANFSFINSPVLLPASTNILQNGKLNAPGSVLSAAKIQNTSLCLSSISISATPGPIPLTFPEKESFNKSCPAPYKPWLLAVLVPSLNASHANL